jgi:hypothetical protein
VCLVYVIDAYRPVAGEVTLAAMGFKGEPLFLCPAKYSLILTALFGFLLSFYTNPWINMAGYLNAYGAMAGISAGVLLMWIPFYIWGKRIRQTTWNWSITSHVHWSKDREVGE